MVLKSALYTHTIKTEVQIMVEHKEEILKQVAVNAEVKTAGDSIYGAGNGSGAWDRDGANVPNSIYVSTVQIIETTYFNDDGTVDFKSTEGLIFHPLYDGWEVYTDSKFCKNVAEAAGLTDFVKYFDFSEQGMQYTNACHLDVEVA